MTEPNRIEVSGQPDARKAVTDTLYAAIERHAWAEQEAQQAGDYKTAEKEHQAQLWLIRAHEAEQRP